MDNLKQYVKSFLNHISIEKNYSKATEKTYSDSLNIFITFLRESNLDIFNKSSIADFIQFLRQRKNSDITISLRLTVIKSFFLYLIKIKVVKKRQLPIIERYKTTKKIINIPSDNEVNQFIDSIKCQLNKLENKEKIEKKNKAKHFALIRNLAFFSLTTATGLRISEALKIKNRDINWNEFSIKIFGKGSKERLIFFGIEKLINLLKDLIKVKNEYFIESEYLFVSYQHKKPLTSRYIQMIMKEYIDNVFTEKKTYTPHTLRHYYATRSIENGADIKAISILLGHADVSTTINMYYHISKKILREVFEKLNPLANITADIGVLMKKRYEMLVKL
jgi:site-specific recombinase XerD